jgi:regulatory protein
MSDRSSRSGATTFVVNSLAVKAQSVAEIETKLARRGVSEQDAAAVVDEARRLGFLDDAALAGYLARGFVERGYGRRRAAATLRRRRLDPGAAAAALDAAFGTTDEVELARRALGRRPTADEADRRRAAAFLARRGFSSAAAWAAIRAPGSGSA